MELDTYLYDMNRYRYRGSITNYLFIHDWHEYNHTDRLVLMILVGPSWI
jgi:hypothetical protein